MSEVIEAEATPVHYHDCPALGPQTKIIRALRADADGEFVLGWQLKCPFCSTTAGPFELAPGVTINAGGGYCVDTTVAIKMEPVK